MAHKKKVDADPAAALDRAAGLLEANDHSAAASLAEGVLDGANRSLLSRAALIRGKALLDPLLSQIMHGEKEEDYPQKEAFREVSVGDGVVVGSGGGGGGGGGRLSSERGVPQGECAVRGCSCSGRGLRRPGEVPFRTLA